MLAVSIAKIYHDFTVSITQNTQINKPAFRRTRRYCGERASPAQPHLFVTTFALSPAKIRRIAIHSTALYSSAISPPGWTGFYLKITQLRVIWGTFLPEGALTYLHTCIYTSS
jgi:hypothetical protein